MALPQKKKLRINGWIVGKEALCEAKRVKEDILKERAINKYLSSKQISWTILV
jgi:hypothetical protein